MNFKNISGVLACSLVLVACDSGETATVVPIVPPTPPVVVVPESSVLKNLAAISMVASDYSSSSVAVVANDSGRTLVEGYIPETKSDYVVNVYGTDVFRVGRYNIDDVTRVNQDNPNQVVSQYTTKDSPSDATSNPYGLAFVSATKAYLLRYNSDKLWIVNPSATQQADYKLGEIDLSAYDAVGDPEMAFAKVIGNKAYIVMQRLNGFSADKVGYVAVIDTATDTEIDTTPANSADLKGIALNVQNPSSVSVFGTQLYVAGVGSFGGTQSGGLDVVFTDTYTVRNLWLDADVARTEGSAYSVAVSSADKGVVVFDEKGFAATERSAYAFNPTTGVIEASSITGFGSIDIRAVAYESTQKEFWLGLGKASKPELAYLNDQATAESRDRTATTLIPTQIDFFELP